MKNIVPKLGIFDKEEEIIEKYISDKKGLVLDHIKNKRLIKYFEYPFSFDKFIFGKFSQSDIYQIAETLLQEKVCIYSMEIHSRIALGTKIPPHQDNAYYGLKRGKALTFYIPLDKQNPFEGGLSISLILLIMNMIIFFKRRVFFNSIR